MQKLCCVHTRQQFSASLDYFVTSLPPYLHQFSTICGGNCITTGHNTSEVDWGGHDPNPNHMNESLLSEVDWGAHDSSVFLFLVNIDYDAKPNESSIQGLWRELHHRTSFIPLIGLQTDSLATGQNGDDIFNSTPFNTDLDDPEQLTGESIQSFLTLVVQVQWLVVLVRLVTHAQVTTMPKLMVG